MFRRTGGVSRSGTHALRSRARPASRRITRRQVQSAASWSGPIPSPIDMERYEAVLPGAADRILTMTENQSAHRIDLANKAASGDSIRSYLGIVSALLISLAIIAASIYLISKGHSWEGVSLIGIDLIGLASVFIYGTRARQSERERKFEMMSEISRR